MNIILSKLKEVVFAVLPISVLVLLLHFTAAPLETPMLIRFIIGALLIVFGLTVFLFGVDIGVAQIGNTMGSAVAKSNKLWVVASAGLVLGFFISVAEPDLHILAGMVDAVSAGLIAKGPIVVVVSAGIAVMTAIGLIRILYNIPLHILLFVVYGVIFILALFTSPAFLAVSFDASGATTGALTVPFILALAAGVSRLKKDSGSAENDSFGLVALASSGAVIALMLMSILAKTGDAAGTAEVHAASGAVIAPFLQKFPVIAMEVLVALSPVLAVFLLFQQIKFRLSRTALRRILFGVLFTFVGLVVFLVGVNAGFMEVGRAVGYALASMDNKFIVIAVGFLLGFVTILAEPAVYVLTHQIEDVTGGYVSRKLVLGALSIGVGIAVALSVVRILVPGLELWHYLLPGYMISVALMFFVPKLFVGIAFDSGGVASGPMTATFILAFTQGAAAAAEGADAMTEGFGMIAMVAMTPLIALQVLGLLFKLKSKKGGL